MYTSANVQLWLVSNRTDIFAELSKNVHPAAIKDNTIWEISKK